MNVFQNTHSLSVVIFFSDMGLNQTKYWLHSAHLYTDNKTICLLFCHNEIWCTKDFLSIYNTTYKKQELKNLQRLKLTLPTVKSQCI